MVFAVSCTVAEIIHPSGRAGSQLHCLVWEGAGLLIIFTTGPLGVFIMRLRAYVFVYMSVCAYTYGCTYTLCKCVVSVMINYVHPRTCVLRVTISDFVEIMEVKMSAGFSSYTF